MEDYVLFQMWAPYRQQLIASHEFYVAEAKRRLLDQFIDENMKVDADRFAEEWLARTASSFDPDSDDPSSSYEQAYDEGVSFYLRLDDLRKVIRLSIIAGMYHEWEKQLRDWLAREVMRVAPGEHMRATIWRQTVGGILDFLESWRWPVRTRAYFNDLHVCHLVVNVYKHGAGPSLTELNALEPKLVGHDTTLPKFITSVLDHTALSVEDVDISRFSDAIVAFWRDVPENTFQWQISEEPPWLRQALQKDLDAQRGRRPRSEQLPPRR